MFNRKRIEKLEQRVSKLEGELKYAEEYGRTWRVTCGRQIDQLAKQLGCKFVYVPDSWVSNHYELRSTKSTENCKCESLSES